MHEQTIIKAAGTASCHYTFKQEFSIGFSYNVYFTRDVFNPGNQLLASIMATPATLPKVLVCLDSGVADHNAALDGKIQSWFREHAAVLRLVKPPYIVPGGEQAKNSWDNLHRLTALLAEGRLDRQNFVMAVGGGSVLDMVGFAAAIVHRGLRLIRVPTTVLAQNDAGVGVKNGMNDRGAKNFVGTFAPPYAVVNDATLLTTLSPEDWLGGIAEAVKVALIKDRDFFEFIRLRAGELKARNLQTMEELVQRCAVLHLEHIRTQGDPFEFGSSRPLDFGHWAAHRLEVLSGFRVGHGQAVAAGIALDSCYAFKKNFIPANDLESILGCLDDCGLPAWHPLLEKLDAEGDYEILKGLEQFREHLGGKLCITLPGPLGHKVEVHEMETGLVIACIHFLKSRVR